MTDHKVNSNLLFIAPACYSWSEKEDFIWTNVQLFDYYCNDLFF